jgi:hypothetical protein
MSLIFSARLAHAEKKIAHTQLRTHRKSLFFGEARTLQKNVSEIQFFGRRESVEGAAVGRESLKAA